MLAFSSFLTGGLDQVHGGFLARQSSRSPRVTCKEAQGRNPGEPGWEGGLARAKGRDRNGLHSATIQARGPDSFFLLPGERWGCPALSPLGLEVASSPPAPSTPTGLSQSQQAGSQGKHAAEPGAPR